MFGQYHNNLKEWYGYGGLNNFFNGQNSGKD